MVNKKYSPDDPNLELNCKVHGKVNREGIKIRLKKRKGGVSYNYECKKCNGIRKRACRNKKNYNLHQKKNAKRRRDKITKGYVRHLMKRTSLKPLREVDQIVKIKQVLILLKREIKKIE